MKAKKVLRRLIPGSFLILPLILAVAAPGQKNSARIASTQQVTPDDVVRVETNLVTIPARVMDRDGRYITDLRKEDFQIFEDGVEQEVAFFSPVDRPFTMLLLLDFTGSMIEHKENLSRAISGLIDLLHPDDQLIAAKFFPNDLSADTLIPATRVSELHKSIKLKFREDRDCSTLIYDVVDDAIKRMKKISGRKAIVLLSDGEGTGIFATANSTLHKAEEQDALIYTIQFGTLRGEPPREVSREVYFERIEEINGYMRGLAQKTGGRYYEVAKMANTEPFGQIFDDLRRQYSLGYYPKRPLEAGQRREIKVKVRLPNLSVRARDSYIIDKDRVKGK